MNSYTPHAYPDFSIIITCFNDGEYIDEAINSVLRSTFNKTEIIIVDDCSSDAATKKKLNELADAGFSIIRKNTNAGVSDSRNKGIAAARGKYILTLDADDRIHPEYLSKAYPHLENGFSVVYCNVKRFGEKESVTVPPEFSFPLLLAGNFIVNCSPFTKAVWEKTGGFDTKMNGYEDWEFWIHVAERGGTFYHLDELLFEYRIKAQSRNNKLTNPEYRSETVRYVCTKHRESYQAHVGDIVPYLHKVISSHEADYLKTERYKKSIFWKIKRAIDKLSG